MKVPQFDIEIKAYSKKELRLLYGVKQDVFRNWLNRIKEHIPDYNQNTRILTPAQVKAIIEKLGEP